MDPQETSLAGNVNGLQNKLTSLALAKTKIIDQMVVHNIDLFKIIDAVLTHNFEKRVRSLKSTQVEGSRR